MSNSQQGGPRQGQPLYQNPAFQQPMGMQAHMMQGQAPQGHPQGGMPGGAPQSGGKAKRRVRNFLLQPLLQVKIGLFSILLSVLFAGAVAALLYFNFFPLIDTVLKMTDADEEVRDFFMDEWRAKQLWVYLAFFVYLVAQIAMSVLYTHRLVGPTYAFRRHIRSIAEGRYNARTYLRKGDGFIEVADELNNLSEVMERKFGGGAQQQAQPQQAPQQQAGQYSQHGGTGHG